MRLNAPRTCLLILITVGLLMVSQVSMAETGGKEFDEIKISVEQSSLSLEKKTSLLKRSSDAISAGVPSADIAVIVKRGLARGMDGRGIEDFIGIAVKSKEQNLPVRPVLDRIQQGLSKGVPPEQISGSARRLGEKLATADKIVDGLEKSGVKVDKRSDKENGTRAVARALEKTIPEDMITKMGMKVAQKRGSFTTFSASINTITTFVEMGMPLEHASKLINKAMDKGYSEKEMIGMERDMSYMMREGWMMDDAMKSMETMMNKGFAGNMHKGMGTGPGLGSGAGMGGSPSMPAAPGGGMHHGGPGMGRH